MIWDECIKQGSDFKAPESGYLHRCIRLPGDAGATAAASQPDQQRALLTATRSVDRDTLCP